MIYLDPKADLTFKKVFGEHPDLVMNLLNALLPLEEGEEIKEVEYLPAELVPETPLKKNSIVDVRCRDAKGRLMHRKRTCASWVQVISMNCCSRCIHSVW